MTDSKPTNTRIFVKSNRGRRIQRVTLNPDGTLVLYPSTTGEMEEEYEELMAVHSFAQNDARMFYSIQSFCMPPMQIESMAFSTDSYLQDVWDRLEKSVESPSEAYVVVTLS